jgi:hypothetical protein
VLTPACTPNVAPQGQQIRPQLEVDSSASEKAPKWGAPPALRRVFIWPLGYRPIGDLTHLRPAHRQHDFWRNPRALRASTNDRLVHRQYTEKDEKADAEKVTRFRKK